MKKQPTFPDFPLEGWQGMRVDRIDLLEQSPTLTRAEVWIDGEGYAFEHHSYLTVEEINIRARKFAYEQKGN